MLLHLFTLKNIYFSKKINYLGEILKTCLAKF